MFPMCEEIWASRRELPRPRLRDSRARLTQETTGLKIQRVLPKSGPVAQLGARFHGMEEVIGSIPIRSTKQPLQNQAYAGSASLPPLGCLVSFGVKRGEGLRRVLSTSPAGTDFRGLFRLCLPDFLNSELMELMVSWTLSGISCMYTSAVVAARE